MSSARHSTKSRWVINRSPAGLLREAPAAVKLTTVDRGFETGYLAMIAITLAGLSLVDLAVWVIVAAAIIAIVVVVTKAMGVGIPQWVITICWIIFAAVVGILAIKLLVSIV